MRKFVAVMIVVMGMSIGVLVAYKDSWSGRFAMMGLSRLVRNSERFALDGL